MKIQISGVAALIAAGALSSGCTPGPESLDFRFDDLGGGSENIFVYEGAEDEFSGLDVASFASGQIATAECFAIGRIISSDTSQGERPRESNIWLRLKDTQNNLFPDGFYATIVYSDLEDDDVAKIGNC